MPLLTELLSNQSPAYAKYRGINACRHLAASKQPSGVCLIKCGEIWMRLMAGWKNDQTRTQANVAYSNAQICAGLQSGIDGNLHAVRDIWPQSAGWTHNGDIPGEDGDDDLDDGTAPSTQPSQLKDSCATENPPVDAGVDEDDTYSGYRRGNRLQSGALRHQKCIL